MPSSSISTLYSEDEIREMQAWLKEHPIDHKYDDICDSMYDGFDVAVLQQLLSRSYCTTLKRLGVHDNFIEELKDDKGRVFEPENGIRNVEGVCGISGIANRGTRNGVSAFERERI